MAKRVPFIVAAFGKNVDPFMLHIYAALAEQERRLISQRAPLPPLRKPKARGVVLGSPEGARKAKQAAAVRDEELRPVLEELGSLSANAIARTLIAREIKTPRGKTWTAKAVTRMQDRLGLR